MTNPFYSKVFDAQPGTSGRSTQVDDEFASIEAAFDAVDTAIAAAATGAPPVAVADAGKFMSNDGATVQWSTLGVALESIADLTPAADLAPYFTGASSAATMTVTSFGRSLLDDADAATARGTLDAQQSNAKLTSFSALSGASDSMAYFTGPSSMAVTSLSSFARSLLDDTDAATARATLGVGTGTGSVTSVDVSGGTTGMSFSGGPVINNGVITMSGTLAVANGGSGQTSFTNGQLLIGNSSGNTLTKATLTQGTGISIANGAGSITVSASTMLQAVNNLSGTGLIVRNGSGTATTRSIAAGTGIAVSNGDGVSGNPTISLSGAAIKDTALTMATSRLLGRTTASSGTIEEISVGSGLSLSGGALAWLGGIEYIGAATASSSTSLDFTDLTTHTHYLFVFDRLLAASAAASTIRLRFSTNNGSSYVSSSDYTSTDEASGTSIIVQNTATDGANGGTLGVSGMVLLLSPYVSAYTHAHIFVCTNAVDVAADALKVRAGSYRANAQVNAVRFFHSLYNLASGNIRCYGIK